MGKAIASVVTKGGNTAELLGSEDTAKPATGDIVVLALPYSALAEVLDQRGDQLDGKVVVDITNPLSFETFDSLVVPADSSAAAEDGRLRRRQLIGRYARTAAPLDSSGVSSG